jgi:hypothetical protein
MRTIDNTRTGTTIMFRAIGIIAGILLTVLGATAASPVAATPCPPEVANTRVLVERLLTRAAHLPSRQETGLVGVAPSSIRRLQDGSDDAACLALNSQMGSSTGQKGDRRWTYYAAGGRYFVAVQPVAVAGEQRVGYVPVYVYDSSTRLLGAYPL